MAAKVTWTTPTTPTTAAICHGLCARVLCQPYARVLCQLAACVPTPRSSRQAELTPIWTAKLTFCSSSQQWKSGSNQWLREQHKSKKWETISAKSERDLPELVSVGFVFSTNVSPLDFRPLQWVRTEKTQWGVDQQKLKISWNCTVIISCRCLRKVRSGNRPENIYQPHTVLNSNLNKWVQVSYDRYISSI